MWRSVAEAAQEARRREFYRRRDELPEQAEPAWMWQTDLPKTAPRFCKPTTPTEDALRDVPASEVLRDVYLQSFGPDQAELVQQAVAQAAAPSPALAGWGTPSYQAPLVWRFSFY